MSGGSNTQIDAPGAVIRGQRFIRDARFGDTGIHVTQTVPGAAILIHGNRIHGYTTGIRVASGQGVSILGNSIYDNTLAIDLGTDGPTPNDPAPDADLGPNLLQN
ncbi:MAG: hypothetical protein ACLGH0_15760, partial [Thermoanaerobaculia bacterium]